MKTYTAGNMPLLNDPIYHELAMQEFERRKRNDTIIRSAMAAISIGLAIASFGSMSGVSAAILGGLSVGVSGIDAYMTYHEYDQIAPAGNTTFDPEKVLTDEDPSVVWVIASAAGALADGIQLVKLAKQIATLSKVNKALELQNLEKITAKLAGKISEKELAILNDNLHILEGLRKTRQQIAHSIVKHSKEKLDLPAIEQAVDIYMLQHSEELIKAAKSGSFKLSKEAQEEVWAVYGLGEGERGKVLMEISVQNRFNKLSKDPQTLMLNQKSVEEAKAILEAENQGLIVNPTRPNLEIGDPNLDFKIDGPVPYKWADVKTPINRGDLKKMAINIGKKSKLQKGGARDVLHIIDLKNIPVDYKLNFQKFVIEGAGSSDGMVFINN